MQHVTLDRRIKPGAPRGTLSEADAAAVLAAAQTYHGSAPSAPEPPGGTIDDVLDWVGDDPGRAQAALDAENARSSPRSTLVSQLQEIAEQ